MFSPKGQQSFSWRSHAVQTEADPVAHLVEFQGGKIYPNHDVTKVVRLYKPGGMESDQFLSRTARKASLKVFTDTSSEIRGSTEIPVLE